MVITTTTTVVLLSTMSIADVVSIMRVIVGKAAAATIEMLATRPIFTPPSHRPFAITRVGIPTTTTMKSIQPWPMELLPVTVTAIFPVDLPPVLPTITIPVL
jgi:hypothetical protein